MTLADTILRIIAALAEAYVIEIRSATPEQVQAIVARRERDLARLDRLINIVIPGWIPEGDSRT